MCLVLLPNPPNTLENSEQNGLANREEGSQTCGPKPPVAAKQIVKHSSFSGLRAYLACKPCLRPASHEYPVALQRNCEGVLDLLLCEYFPVEGTSGDLGHPFSKSSLQFDESGGLHPFELHDWTLFETFRPMAGLRPLPPFRNYGCCMSRPSRSF